MTSLTQYKRATKKVNQYSKIIELSECEFIRAEWSVRKDQILYYWNQRGMNILEHCDLVFIVGTAVVNRDALVKEFGWWFPNIELSTTEKVEKEPHGTYYHYIDERLENFRRMREEDEMYHAILRARPHLYKKSIYVFGSTTVDSPFWI